MTARVVIVGAGFAGIDCARRLSRRSTARAVDVTLVDRHNFHTFQPLLYQVATSGLAPDDVAHPVRGIFHGAPNIRFRNDEVTGVDWSRRVVTLAGGDTLRFEWLVLAFGAMTNYFGVPGAAEHAFPLYSLDDAVALRNHILEQFERASAAAAPAGDPRLTLTVVGGGPTGVEMAGALVELLRVLARDFPELDVASARVVLLEAADRLLAPFSDRGRQHALDQLRHRGVEVHLGESVVRVGPDNVELRSGAVLATRTVVWAAGVRAHPLAAALGLPTGPAGRIVVGTDLRVSGYDDVFVVGDVAAIPASGERPLPQLAPVAKQSGAFAATQILRLVEGRPPRTFVFRDRGTMATIGRRAAVADLPLRIHLTGTLAWLAWLFLHLLFLVGFRNRLTVLVNWTWSYLTYDRGPRIVLRGPRNASGAT